MFSMKIKDIDIVIQDSLSTGSFIPNALLWYKGVSSTAKLLWGMLEQYGRENGEYSISKKILAGGFYL